MKKRNITDAELNAWEKEQKRAFIAGKLTPEQVAQLRSVGFPLPKFSQTKLGKIIRENELSTEAKYTAFRRKHPELKLPSARSVKVMHTGAYGSQSTKPTAAEFSLMSKRQQAAFFKKLHTLPGYAELSPEVVVGDKAALQVVGNYYPYVVLKVRTPNIIEAAQVVNGEPSLPGGTFRWPAKAGCFVERGVKGTHYKFLRIGGKVHRTYTGVR